MSNLSCSILLLLTFAFVSGEYPLELPRRFHRSPPGPLERMQLKETGHGLPWKRLLIYAKNDPFFTPIPSLLNRLLCKNSALLLLHCCLISRSLSLLRFALFAVRFQTRAFECVKTAFANAQKPTPKNQTLTSSNWQVKRGSSSLFREWVDRVRWRSAIWISPSRRRTPLPSRYR